MAEETQFELVLSTGESTPAVAKLRAEIEQLKDVLKQQAEAYDNGQLPLEHFIEGNRAAATVIRQLEGAIRAIDPPLKTVVAEEEDLAPKVDAATAKLYEQIHAQEAMRDILEEVGPLINNVAGKEGGGSGFLGLATNARKAEQAALAIGTGHGLAKLGPMLESITGALGFGGGVG